jgi:hypothetical protein
LPITVETSGPITSSLPAKDNILQVCQDVALVISLERPEGVFASDLREHLELAALANSIGRRIAYQTHDWQWLKFIATLTGDGVTENTDLPSDFQRLLKKARMWPSAMPNSPLSWIRDTDAWTGYEVSGFTPPFGIWTIIGDQLHVKPVIGDGETVKFAYLSRSFVIGVDATPEDTTKFTADADVFLLDNDVLRLGMIWQWKANKGQAYAEDMANYETALAMAIGGEKEGTILTQPSRHRYAGAEFAFPGSIVP